MVRSYKKAAEYFAAAAQQYLPEADYNLGVMYAEGMLGAVDFGAARQHWQRAVATRDGSPDAMVALAELDDLLEDEAPLVSERASEGASEGGPTNHPSSIQPPPTAT